MVGSRTDVTKLIVVFVFAKVSILQIEVFISNLESSTRITELLFPSFSIKVRCPKLTRRRKKHKNSLPRPSTRVRVWRTAAGGYVNIPVCFSRLKILKKNSLCIQVYSLFHRYIVLKSPSPDLTQHFWKVAEARRTSRIFYELGGAHFSISGITLTPPSHSTKD